LRTLTDDTDWVFPSPVCHW